VRVAIADDAVLVREGIARLLLEHGFDVVGQAADASELDRIIGRTRPDVAIVDLRMPPTHTDEGIRAAADIRTRYPGTGVLVLSQYLDPRYAIRLLEESPAGVGYLLKERVSDIHELAVAIRRIANGESVVDRSVVSELVARRRRRDPLLILSPREREILGLMAEGRSNHGICDALFLSPKTVETHISSIFDKLGLADMRHDNRRVLAVLSFLRS